MRVRVCLVRARHERTVARKPTDHPQTQKPPTPPNQPYFLDAYLGVWGKEILAGDGAALDAGQSALLFLAFFALVLVGTLAAQVYTYMYNI